MTDPHPLSLEAAGPLMRRRQRDERIFRWLGFGAIVLSFCFLAILMYSIISKGYSAFTETTITLTVPISADGDYEQSLKNALLAKFPAVTERRDKLRLYGLFSNNAPQVLEEAAKHQAVPAGSAVTVALPTSSRVDMWHKGKVDVTLSEDRRMLKDMELGWLSTLKSEDAVHSRFNRTFFTNGDSREPEQAGMLGSIIGSFFTILVCMAIAFPIGVASAVYLEEFAPKNRLTDLIEVNINNLAAVPSIVFGLLGLAIFLHFFGMPRSSALVGGCTLSLLVLPTMVIATRQALKSVPPSIRTAAMGLGASPMQVLLHHTLPLAMPGIMTGTILSIARALGETAPLLMIGMVAFVVDLPRSMLEPATAMPVQIYLWSDSPEMGFTERTSAGIIVLLVFLVAANALAVYLRRKFERKW